MTQLHTNPHSVFLMGLLYVVYFPLAYSLCGCLIAKSWKILSRLLHFPNAALFGPLAFLQAIFPEAPQAISNIPHNILMMIQLNNTATTQSRLHFTVHSINRYGRYLITYNMPIDNGGDMTLPQLPRHFSLMKRRGRGASGKIACKKARGPKSAAFGKCSSLDKIFQDFAIKHPHKEYANGK